MSKIIKIARNIVENDNKEEVDTLINIMKVHESQQSAVVVSTIAAIVGSKIKSEVAEVIREKIGDIILWDVPIIKNENDWPERKKYSPKTVYQDEEDEKNIKLIVHGYLGLKASKEMEQFHTQGELKRIAHYRDGVWIAPTRSHSKVTYRMYSLKNHISYIRIPRSPGHSYHSYINNKIHSQ